MSRHSCCKCRCHILGGVDVALAHASVAILDTLTELEELRERIRNEARAVSPRVPAQRADAAEPWLLEPRGGEMAGDALGQAISRVDG